MERNNTKAKIETIKMLSYMADAIDKFKITKTLEEGTEEFSAVLDAMTKDKMSRTNVIKEKDAKSGQEYWLTDIIKTINKEPQKAFDDIYDRIMFDYLEDDELHEVQENIINRMFK